MTERDKYTYLIYWPDGTQEWINILDMQEQLRLTIIDAVNEEARANDAETTNAELLEALKAIKTESDTRDRTAHESLAIIHIAAREAIRKAEEHKA